MARNYGGGVTGRIGGGRGNTYVPFFSQGMGVVAEALGERRDRDRADQVNDLASKAWMGDPVAMQELATLDPQLAMKVEDQAAQRDEQELQRGVDKDQRFVDDLDTAMAQIGAFDTFDEAQSYGQRMTDMMLAKYPERMRSQGFPEQFTEQAYQEIRTITGGATGEPVGVPFRAVDDKGNAVMAQQTKLPNGRTITTYLKDEAGSLVRPAEYDARLAGEVSYGKKAGGEQAMIDLADDKKLAELTAEAKAGIMPARKAAESTIGMITAIKNHPGLTYAVGMGWLNPGKFVPGTDAHNFMILADQAQGKVFSQAYETLKGGGPITEFESKKAGQAIARMETSQSVEEYRAALNDFETAVRDGYDILLNQASGKFETATPLPERGGGAAQFTLNNPATPQSAEEFATLPAGSHFKAPDGSIRVKK